MNRVDRRTQSALPAPEPIILRDGTTAWLRPARSDDVERLEALFQRASRESIWLRFFTSAVRISRREIERMVESDGIERLTSLITRGDGPEEYILGVGNYVRLPRWDTAEVAFFVDDAYQGKGLGTLLLEHLAEHARQQGILTIIATVRPENQRMLDVFRKGGFEPHMAWEEGVIRVELPATPSEVARAQAEARERLATAASLTPFFQPQAVAVIGASRNPASPGRRVCEQLIRTGFSGPVYPVNPHARAIAAVRAFPTILDIPDEIDLAVIAVPVSQVLPVIETCATKRVRALLVLSSGFAETGPEGQRLQADLVRKVRAQGMRLIGPNCIGLLNTDPQTRLNATFTPRLPLRGRLAVSTQSNALGFAVLEYLQQSRLGISTFVNVGNKADVSGNDLLQYWEEDASTELILFYLESFGNPRKFARLARRVARRKPIIAVKSGRSVASTRTLPGLTPVPVGNAQADYTDYAVDALFRQAGVIRAETLEESLDIAAVLSNQPLPEGNRVAIVTNAGGLGILGADACGANGLRLASLTPETRMACQRQLLPGARLENPLDLLMGARPVHYTAAIRQVLQDPNVDAAIVIFLPTGETTHEEVGEALRQAVTAARAVTHKDKPLLGCLMPGWGDPTVLDRRAGSTTHEAPWEDPCIPFLRFPESAARALAHVVAYSEWRRQPLGRIPELARVDVLAAREIVTRALRVHGEGWLSTSETAELFAAVGLSLSEQPHRDGPEIRVQVVEDPLFGPVIGFGLGGAAAEVLNDKAFCITPLTDSDAREIVRAIRGFPVLQGGRGQPRADLEAIEDLLLRISWLVEELPEIAQLELESVTVLPPGQGLSLVVVRVYLRP